MCALTIFNSGIGSRACMMWSAGLIINSHAIFSLSNSVMAIPSPTETPRIRIRTAARYSLHLLTNHGGCLFESWNCVSVEGRCKGPALMSRRRELRLGRPDEVPDAWRREGQLSQPHAKRAECG